MTQHNEIIKIAEKHQLHIKPQTISLNESGLDFQVAFGDFPYESYVKQMKDEGQQQWPKVESALRDKY